MAIPLLKPLRNLSRDSVLDMVEVHSSTLCRPTTSKPTNRAQFSNLSLVNSLSVSFQNTPISPKYGAKRCENGVDGILFFHVRNSWVGGRHQRDFPEQHNTLIAGSSLPAGFGTTEIAPFLLRHQTCRQFISSIRITTNRTGLPKAVGLGGSSQKQLKLRAALHE